MKYVVIFAVVLVVGVGVALNRSVGPEVPLTDLQLDEMSRLSEDVSFPDTELVASRVSAEQEASPAVDPVVEPMTPLEIFLAAQLGSPLGLLPADEAAKYLATRASLVAWIKDTEELDDVDADAIELTDDLRYLWGTCQEHMALHIFILDHQERERERWQNREQSVSLEAELGSVRAFMDRGLGHDAEVWRLISLYSDEVAAEILDSGEDAANGDDPASRWDLLSALADAGAPSFDALVETLRNSR